MSQPAGAAPVCYRHPDRETWIRCQRCEKPICPDCMTPAAVGFQCPSCVKEGSRSVRAPRRPFGGGTGGNPALTSFVLIGINVLVWLLVRSEGSPSRLVDSLQLLPQAPVGVFFNGAELDSVAGGQYWQVITSAFTHIELLHIAFNMLALYFLGPQLEAVLGRARFLALYLGSALTGSTAVMLLSDPNTPTIGASGAIFGLLGALIVVAVRLKADLSQLLLWLGINVAYTFSGLGNISWQGHLGGFIGGVLIAGVVVYAPKGARQSLVQWSGIAGVVLVSAALIAVRALALA